MVKDIPNCLVLPKQAVASARDFAADRAGSNMAARIAMIAITTRSSINVKPGRVRDADRLRGERDGSIAIDVSLGVGLIFLLVGQGDDLALNYILLACGRGWRLHS